MNAIRSLLLATVCALAWPSASMAEEYAGRSGEQLYTLCAQCHGENGGGNPAALAPSIAGLPQWYVDATLKKFQLGGRGKHFDDIGGMRMRPMARWLKGDEEIAAVSALVASMEPTNPEPTLEGGDPERGKARYTPCIACHGQDGKGNQALNAPPLVGMSDWYQKTSLENFKAGVRGTNEYDRTGALMRPMSMTLRDEQAVLDVIAYIMSLREE